VHVQREGIALGSPRAETFSKAGRQGSLAKVTREKSRMFSGKALIAARK
jgi:hypothetical protein